MLNLNAAQIGVAPPCWQRSVFKPPKSFFFFFFGMYLVFGLNSVVPSLKMLAFLQVQ